MATLVAPHRTSMKRNMLMALFSHERITTTIPKAKIAALTSA